MKCRDNAVIVVVILVCPSINLPFINILSGQADGILIIVIKHQRKIPEEEAGLARSSHNNCPLGCGFFPKGKKPQHSSRQKNTRVS
jgi:hypothetical protein